MLSLFIFLIIIILKADALGPDNENPEINLTSLYGLSMGNYTVWKDKPLKIIIEDGSARYIHCYDTCIKYVGKLIKVEEFIKETELSNGNVHILNIPKVTAEMSTRWSCTIYQEAESGPVTYKHRKYAMKDPHFFLHVKGARAVILTANNQSLTYVTTDLSVNYDGEANYTYEDGDDFLIDFSCKKADDNCKNDTLRLEYYNAEGILLFKTKPRENQPHVFRSVLKSNNDKYYLDCIRDASLNPETEYRYRTTFFKRDLHADVVQNAVMLYVNGQELSTFSNNDKTYDDYIFRYIDGEVLNVTCRKMNVTLSGALTFYSDKEIVHHISKALRSLPEAVISLNISTSDIQNKSLTCSINNTDVEKPSARLLFLSDVPKNDVRIRGLSRNNILYQYTNEENQWTIEYEYYATDTLNLTCVWNNEIHLTRQRKPFMWEFEDQTKDSAAIEMPSSSIQFSELPFTKILDASHNGTKIKCIYFTNVEDSNINRTVEIILRLKPELVSEKNEIVSGLAYYLTAAGVSVSIILVIIYWTVKKSSCCIRSSSQELPSVPTPKPHPNNVFYLNLLSVFRPINEREAMELENHYEEIE